MNALVYCAAITVMMSMYDIVTLLISLIDLFIIYFILIIIILQPYVQLLLKIDYVTIHICFIQYMVLQ